MPHHFMVEFEIPHTLSSEFVTLIPDQRKIVHQMMSDGKIINYSLASDQSRLWIVIMGDSEYDVADILATLPLTSFMNFRIRALAFYNSADFVMSLSLN